MVFNKKLGNTIKEPIANNLFILLNNNSNNHEFSEKYLKFVTFYLSLLFVPINSWNDIGIDPLYK